MFFSVNCQASLQICIPIKYNIMYLENPLKHKGKKNIVVGNFIDWKRMRKNAKTKIKSVQYIKWDEVQTIILSTSLWWKDYCRTQCPHWTNFCAFIMLKCSYHKSIMGELRGEKRESAQKNKEKHLKGVSETCLKFLGSSQDLSFMLKRTKWNFRCVDVLSGVRVSVSSNERNPTSTSAAVSHV